jgi:hypothetical protein
VVGDTRVAYLAITNNQYDNLTHHRKLMWELKLKKKKDEKFMVHMIE